MKPVPPMKKARTEMLPLMDMIFLLLVVFIFMIVQMRPGFGVSVDLPQTTASETPRNEEQKSLTISVTTDNKLFIDDKESDLTSIVSTIQLEQKNNKKISIILRGDSGAHYGNIMNVFAACKENNINSIIFDFEKK